MFSSTETIVSGFGAMMRLRGGDGRGRIGVVGGGPTANWNIAPTHTVPVVREFVDDDGEVQRSLELARWGLYPAWAKDKGPRPINARLETIATNGMFRGPFSSGRAIVPMTGYYEWV